MKSGMQTVPGIFRPNKGIAVALVPVSIEGPESATT